MNQQIIENNGQHLPSKIQVARDPVRKVSKSLQQTTYRKKLTTNDLLGLSWMLFEEDND
ncbi:MAG: hypothetical protein ACR2LL_05785 [Nitrosopumilus sp.]